MVKAAAAFARILNDINDANNREVMVQEVDAALQQLQMQSANTADGHKTVGPEHGSGGELILDGNLETNSDNIQVQAVQKDREPHALSAPMCLANGHDSTVLRGGSDLLHDAQILAGCSDPLQGAQVLDAGTGGEAAMGTNTQQGGILTGNNVVLHQATPAAARTFQGRPGAHGPQP
ncbi:uncharacterized protein [Setaria viridis]|uniref:uncharacterized protein isoform X1 n=1 Tax=Setaria viridis TaxID=4556 RepID=UPI003B3B2656